MKKLIQTSLLLIASVAVIFTATPANVQAVDLDPDCDTRVALIPAWYNGMMTRNDKNECEFQPVDGDPNKEGKVSVVKTAGKIGTNILQALLILAGYVAVFFLIKGGYMYIYSAGSPEGIAGAKKAIQNALIGLVIASLAAAIVNAIGAVI